MKILYIFEGDNSKDKMIIFKDRKDDDQKDFSLTIDNQDRADITEFIISRLSYNTLKHLKTFGDLYIDFGNVRLINFLVLEDQPLASIEVEYNELKDNDAKNISDILSINYSLRLISLQGNLITNIGVKPLACALLSNNSLKSLDLSYNSISDSGAEYLAAALTSNSTVEFLNLTANFITAIGVEHLAKMLVYNSTLRVLKLAANTVKDEGAYYIAESLKINKTLTEIDLRYSEIGPEGFGIRALKKCLFHNNFKLKILNLYISGEKEIWTNSHIEDIEFYLEQNLSLAGDSSSAEDLI